jgi:peptide/nickel transport system ATP-binding protein
MTISAQHPPLVIKGLSVSLPDNGDGSRGLLDAIDLYVGPGEIVGLVGESGSGKSLTSRSALGLFPRGARITGSVAVDGIEVVGSSAAQLREIRRTRASMIFQDPRSSVNAVRRVGDFITEGLRAQGIDRRDANSRAIELLGEVGIREPEKAMKRYPHEFSGGMLQRIVIAGALTIRPRLLLADEATTALDVTTQAEVVGLLKQLQTGSSAGLLFVTHDLDLAAVVCDRIYVMYAGRVVETASTDAVFATPQHPYTAGLINSTPNLNGELIPLVPIAGRPRALADAPDGCAFRDRAPIAVTECAHEIPPLVTRRASDVACIRPGETEVVR